MKQGKVKGAKAAAMQPKHRSITIKPDKGKGSYDRADQMDWIYEYEGRTEDTDDMEEEYPPYRS